MMEVILLLKLEVSADQFKKGNDTDDDIKSKIRAYIADVVGDEAARQKHITLLSSSVAVEIEPTGTVQIQPSNPVLKIFPDMKMEI